MADVSLIQGNLLSLDLQSNENAATPWAVNTNCTLATSATQAHDGTQAVACTTLASGTVKFASPVITIPKACQLHFEVQSRGGASNRVITLYADFYLNGTYVRSGNNAGLTNSITAWTKHSWEYNMTSASNSVLNGVVFGVQFTALGASEIQYFDRFYLTAKGAGLWPLLVPAGIA